MKGKYYVLGNTIVAALGGFLFGFDTAVISGTTRDLEAVFQLDANSLGFTVAIALIGTIIGSLMVGRPGDTMGRKKVLIILAVFYTVSALGSALVSDWYLFLFFRFLGGLAVGGSSVLAPMYIAEISPAAMRGRLVAVQQFNVVFGILLAFLSNYFLAEAISENAWRWMLGVEAIPALLFFILLFFIPDSPRWLVGKNRYEEARSILTKIGEPNVAEELAEIQQSLSMEDKVSNEHLFQSKYKFPVTMAILIAVFNQVSGINAIMYYAPRIFEMTGLSTDVALVQSVAIGVTNMVFTLLAMTVIDRLGRKKLMLIGSIGMVVALGLVARVFFSNDFTGYGILIYLIAFIAFFAFSQGAVIWVFISEIFPNKVRSKGQALGSFTHWLMAAVVSWTFPVVAEGLGGGAAFTFFAVMMLVQGIWVWKFMPETKGKSLEELGRDMEKATTRASMVKS